MQNVNRGRKRCKPSPLPAVLLAVVLLCAGGVACYSILRDGGIGSGQQLVQPQASTQQPPKNSQVSTGEDMIPGEEVPAGGQPEAGPNPEASFDSENDAKPEPSGFSYNPDDWRLVLVNQAHKLESDYAVELGAIGNYQLDKRILEDTQAMLAAAKKDGYTLTIYSAYRPMERSRVLYNGKVNEYVAAGYSREAAEKEAARWIAPPGTSEHNTGLALDIISGDYFTKFNDLVHEFETCPEFTWLSNNCAEYGFVLRYPKDKQEITGITYEPWHYRYVGREAAKYMMERKISLEELWA